jgi:hypothetical protein
MDKALLRLATAVFSIGGLFGVAEDARATAFCTIKRTRDGFVALRAAPSPQGKLLGRMREGDEVMIVEGKKGNWIRVEWYRGQDRHEKGFGKISGKGWAHGKLIGDECG